MMMFSLNPGGEASTQSISGEQQLWGGVAASAKWFNYATGF